MSTYTIFALYKDDQQRFCHQCEATSPQDAETQARAWVEPEALLIAGVIEGEHQSVDAPVKTYGYE